MLVALLLLCLTSLSLPLAHGEEGHNPSTSAPQPGNLLGARTPLSTSDPEVTNITRFAVENFNKGSNSVYYYRGIRLIKAERQLVAGVKYFLTMEMGSTMCRKGETTVEGVNLAGCPLSTEEEKIKCDFEVLVVPWKSRTTLEKISCDPM